jgi:Fe-S-cluster-containing dehydrogenase component/DMSO reductase anchor subunit
MRSGFLFDLNKCVGCEACVVACQIENHGQQSEPWRSIGTFNSFQHPALPLFHFSLACNHCEEPSCLTSCPASAFSIDPLYHTVDHNQELCIGCGYCTWTCPYDAPKYVSSRGIIEKCSLCKERILDGQKPNCANLCPTGALDFGEIESKGATDVLGFTNKGIWPGIKIVPLRKEGPPITAACSLRENEALIFPQTKSRGERKSTLKSEWPLVLFTLLAAFLFATVAASLFGAPLLDPMTYIALALGSVIVSIVHLGKPLRAWRALANVHTSWLSREIVAFTLFLGGSGLFLFVWPSMLVGFLCMLLGLATLVSIDMVYTIVGRRIILLEKSGSVVVTGILLFAVLAQVPFLSVVMLVGSGVVYIRELLTNRRNNLQRLFVSSVRIAVGFVLPLILLGVQENFWFVALFVLIGESINRAEFYLDLDIVTPQKQLDRDFLKELALRVTEQ